MKRKVIVLIALVLVLALPALSFADSNDVKWDSYLKPGNIVVSAGIGLGWGLSVAIYPGVEVIMAQIKLADVVPLQFGAAVKGMINPYGWAGYSGLFLGAGGFATAHLSFKGLDLPFDYLDKLDYYLGLGFSVNFDTGGYFSDYYNSGINIGFASYSGLSYFLNDNLAIYLEGNYWAYYGGGTVGVIFKL